MNDDYWQGKVALVTGSARGIGRSIAHRFAQLGATAIIADRDLEGAERTVAALVAEGLSARSHSVDLTQPGAAAALVRDVAATCGRLDVLVNNARAGGRSAALAETEDNWDLTMGVVLKAAYFASQEAVAVMAGKGGGSIVNIGSVASRHVSGESAVYHAANAGLEQATRVLAAQAGAVGVRVNAVLPGFIIQDEHRARYDRDDNAAYRRRAELGHPLASVGSSADVAEAVVYLSSPAARFIPGHSLLVDGGLLLNDPWQLATLLAKQGAAP